MSDRIRAGWPTVVLAIVGLAISIYLTVIHYRHELLTCGLGGDCETVQSSKWAMIGPIPLALFGVAMCAAVIALAVARMRLPHLAVPATGIMFAVALSGLLYESYLTYLELFVIDAICVWCVAFAIVLLLLVIAEGFQIWRLVESQEEDMK